MNAAILTLNAGSSSIKFAVYEEVSEQLRLMAKGQVEGIGSAPHFIVHSSQGHQLSESYWEPVKNGHGHARALEQIWSWLAQSGMESGVKAVGHRIAHGGRFFSQPVLIDSQVTSTLTELIPLAPLHQPHNLAPVKALLAEQPEVPQVACFDTAFHQGRKTVTERIPLPQQYTERGLRRYGFHGLSYEYITHRLKVLAPDLYEGRVVVAHLGSGCSMAAIRQGRSIDTSMSFSALDGIPMGTRPGALDPGVLLYLMREYGMGADELEALLYKQSGLLGLSGISNDMRQLHASEDPRAKQAIEYFVYRIGQMLGALTATLGGIDGLVFTAGIGEHDNYIRNRICEDASWLGIETDPDQPGQMKGGGWLMSNPQKRPAAWVIPTNEEKMIATHTLRIVQELGG